MNEGNEHRQRSWAKKEKEIEVRDSKEMLLLDHTAWECTEETRSSANVCRRRNSAKLCKTRKLCLLGDDMASRARQMPWIAPTPVFSQAWLHPVGTPFLWLVSLADPIPSTTMPVKNYCWCYPMHQSNSRSHTVFPIQPPVSKMGAGTGHCCWRAPPIMVASTMVVCGVAN